VAWVQVCEIYIILVVCLLQCAYALHLDQTGGGATKPPPNNTSQNSSVQNSSAKNWTQAQVKTWLASVSLSHLHKHMSDFDGNRLVQLCKMYRTAPTAFYQSSERLLHIDKMCDLLALAEALEALTI
jgi:hypothetical protein